MHVSSSTSIHHHPTTFNENTKPMSTTPSASTPTSIQYQQLTPQQQQDLGGDFSKASIQQLFQQTFSDAANEQEGKTVGQLSWDLMDQTPHDDLFVYVATCNNTVVGCIMFSRLIFPQQASTISFLLSPVAVRTSFQKRGIGKGLLQYAIDELSNKTDPKIDLLMTYGDPNYYSKVGFQHVTTDIIPAPLPLSMPQGWLALPLYQKEIQSIPGTSTCVAALNKKDLW